MGGRGKRTDCGGRTNEDRRRKEEGGRRRGCRDCGCVVCVGGEYIGTAEGSTWVRKAIQSIRRLSIDTCTCRMRFLCLNSCRLHSGPHTTPHSSHTHTLPHLSLSQQLPAFGPRIIPRTHTHTHLTHTHCWAGIHLGIHLFSTWGARLPQWFAALWRSVWQTPE